MNSIASAVSQLESRRKALELELAGVNSRLKAIHQALGASVRGETDGVSRAAAGAQAPAARSARRKGRKLRQYMAVSNAVKAGKASRTKDGLVRLR